MLNRAASRLLVFLAPMVLGSLAGCDANFTSDRELQAEKRAKSIERAAARVAAQRVANGQRIRTEEGERMALSNGYMRAKPIESGQSDAALSAAVTASAPAPEPAAGGQSAPASAGSPET